MKTEKSQGLSLNTLIISILMLIVIVTVVWFFTNKNKCDDQCAMYFCESGDTFMMYYSYCELEKATKYRSPLDICKEDFNSTIEDVELIGCWSDFEGYLIA